MKKVKILTIVLAIVLVALVAFGGVYVQTQNRMENKVKDYALGRELDSQRVVEIKVKTSTDEEESTEKNEEESAEEKKEEATEEENATPSFNEESLNVVKNTLEARLKSLGAQDYTLSVNKADGTIRVEFPENDRTDMYVYYLTAKNDIEVVDKDAKTALVTEDMVKSAKYTYTSNASGEYQVYEEIELTKDGQAKLNEILNDYALLETEVDEIEKAQEEKKKAEEENTEGTEVTDNNEQNAETTEEENTETPTKKVANLNIGGTAYDVSKIEKGKIIVKIGSQTSNTTSVNNYISQAAEIAMLENSGKMPIEYELTSNRYEYSSITKTGIMYFAIGALAVLAIILVVYCVIYKKAGILASISFIGFLAIYSLLIRYTNVLISVEGIGAIIITIIINLVLNQQILSKTKKLNLVGEAFKITYKQVFSTLIPVIILTIVTCLSGWESLSSFGMVMFWGIALIAAYNVVITRTLLKLKEN